MSPHTAASDHQVLLVEEVAALLRMSPDSVRKRLKAGDLPGVKVGGEWRIPKARLDAWLDGTEDGA